MIPPQSFAAVYNGFDFPKKGRFFLTHGGGFVGKWLLESVRYLNTTQGADLHVTALVRHPNRFREKYPRLADDPAIRLLKGNVLEATFPDEPFDGVLHVDVAPECEPDPEQTFDSVVMGARHLLDWAKGQPRLLYMSTGAVYGSLPVGMERIPETWSGSPDPMLSASAFGLCKRMAENICIVASEKTGLDVVIARMFNAVGPYFPLDPRRALGSFFRNALEGGPVQVHGDGMDVRSYLFAADMTRWLWTILFRGRPGEAYNVGATRPVSHRELAEIVAREAGDLKLTVELPAQPNRPIQRFLPDTTKARAELGLCETVGLEDAVRITLEDLRQRWEQDQVGFVRARAEQMNILSDQV